MRKTIKKLTAVGLTLTSVMGLVACGNNNASNGTKETVDWASVEKPGHFTIMVDGTVPTLEEWGEKFDEQLKSLTGLDFEVTRPDHNSYYDAVANSMLDASAMPDVIILSSDYLALYASQGLLWDMTDAWANSATKASGRLISDAEKIMQANYVRGVDGEKALYGFVPTRGNGCVTYVKKAWLDNCGLDVPTNYDEYLAMLEAFTTGDPDGNGVNGDTYGVSAAGFIGTEAPYTNYLPEFYQDANPSFYKAEDGTWKDGFTEDSMKSALERMAAAYKEGVIDPTTLTNGTSDCRNKFYDDSFGVFTYWAGTWATNLKTNLEANGKDGELVALPPIAEVGQYLDRVPPVWCITSACENPEGVFKYFIEPMQDGGDVQFLWTYGVEGIHWSTAAETLFAGTENEKTYADGEFHMLENREKEGTQYTKAHIDPMLALVELANDPQEESVAAEAKESAQLFNDNCKAADLVPTTDEMSEYNGDLTTLKNELIAKVVMGEITVDDAYAQFESNHGAEWSQAIVDSLNK